MIRTSWIIVLKWSQMVMSVSRLIIYGLPPPWPGVKLTEEFGELQHRKTRAVTNIFMTIISPRSRPLDKMGGSQQFFSGPSWFRPQFDPKVMGGGPPLDPPLIIICKLLIMTTNEILLYWLWKALSKEQLEGLLWLWDTGFPYCRRLTGIPSYSVQSDGRIQSTRNPLLWYFRGRYSACCLFYQGESSQCWRGYAARSP